MRARCERHQLALGPSGCLLCRREAAAAATVLGDAAAPSARAASAAAPSLAAAAPAVAASVGAPPAGFAPVAASPAALAAFSPHRSSLDPSQAAPATAMDSLPPRQFSVHLTPSMLWLPAAALAAFLILTHLPPSPASREEAAGAAAATAALAAPADQPAAKADDEPDEPDEPDPDEPDDSQDPNAPAPPPPLELGKPLAPLPGEQAQNLKLAAARSDVKVTMYYTDWCQRCLEARGYLAGRGIHTELRNIEKDPKAKAKHRKLNPKGSVPTIVVEGKVQVGFNQQRIDRAIDRAARAHVARKR